MAYQALYRKYRPKDFSDVKGQDVIVKTLKNQEVHTMTYDNGTENAYHSWEKGSIENRNKILRQFFPKGTNFDLISKNEILRVHDNETKLTLRSHCLRYESFVGIVRQRLVVRIRDEFYFSTVYFVPFFGGSVCASLPRYIDL